MNAAPVGSERPFMVVGIQNTQRRRDLTGPTGNRKRTLYLASRGEPELARLAGQLADSLSKNAPPAMAWDHAPMPGEKHATISHPAGLAAFRRVFSPKP